MTIHKRSPIIKFVSLILVFIFMFPCTVSATTTDTALPYASSYLTSYSAYVYVTSSGQAQVWFEVMGTGYMDEIGALRIVLYESNDNKNWTLVKTFLHGSTSNMLFTNECYVSSHVSYQGTYGKHYKAYVTVWAGNNDNGTTRYFWAYEA